MSEKISGKKSSVLTKIWIGAAIIGIITSVAVGVVSYVVVKNYMMEEIRDKTVTTASVAASKIDADAFETISAETGKDETFYDVHKNLSDFLADETISYIYTLRLNGNSMEFVVDADPEEPGELGEEYEVEPEVIEAYKSGKAMALDEPYTDDWGELYSGYAPIKNSNGETVGMVVTDCSTSTVNEKLSSLTRVILLTAALCLVVAMAGGYILAKEFKALTAVALDSQEVAKGNLNVSFSYTKNDEIGDVCRAIENNNRVVKNYINDIDKRLEAISRGDFSASSDVDYIGDYASIKVSLDKISHSLNTVFSGIENASSAVFSGAEGVSAESGHLSESVARQNGLIDEIASGMKLLSDKIDNNVSRTDKAKNTAHQAAGAVEEGSGKMKQLLEAMKEISDASGKIQNIIGTIEDIAFQTNILALNASVEAAHAGAAGKGFAVVADEVRNLAGKSAEASDKTASLIERSVSAAKRGMQIAEGTSVSLDEIVICTEEIEKLIVEINGESYEQRVCVDNVNDKIGNVAEIVNSSAANAEECAASSQELNSQATELKNMLDEFRA